MNVSELRKTISFSNKQNRKLIETFVRDYCGTNNTRTQSEYIEYILMSHILTGDNFFDELIIKLYVEDFTISQVMREYFSLVRIKTGGNYNKDTLLFSYECLLNLSLNTTINDSEKSYILNKYKILISNVEENSPLGKPNLLYISCEELNKNFNIRNIQEMVMSFIRHFDLITNWDIVDELMYSVFVILDELIPTTSKTRLAFIELLKKSVIA